MKKVRIFAIAGAVALTVAGATAFSAGGADEERSPIYGVEIPPGYRDWSMISVAREEGNFNEIRAQLGNDIAIEAYRKGALPFPDGAVIAAIHWEYSASEENNKVFGRAQSFVAGAPKNIQFMVKDSKKYAATGGWGFADFKNGKPASEAVHEACFPCHAPAKNSDYVFTHYAP